MARKLRIDSVSQSAAGVVIGTTASSGALPPTASHNAFMYKTRADLIAAVQTLENSMNDEELFLLAVAIAYKADNALNIAALNSMIGKTITMSLTSGAQLVTVS